MSLTLRSFPSSSELSTISPSVSSIELLLPLKSNRCASSFCACWIAFETSCMSVFETTSNENSCAIDAPRLWGADHVHSRRRVEMEQLGRRGVLVEAGEVEHGAIALAIRVFELLDQVRRRRDRHRH